MNTSLTLSSDIVEEGFPILPGYLRLSYVDFDETDASQHKQIRARLLFNHGLIGLISQYSNVSVIKAGKF